MIHNLDQCTSILLNSKNYQSRYSKFFIPRVSIPSQEAKNLEPIVRRLYRLFTHTYYNHKDIFQEFEVIQCFLQKNEMYLCSRFTEFSKKFNIIQQKFLLIPEEELKSVVNN